MSRVQNLDMDSEVVLVFYKKPVYKKHEAEIRQKLRNTGRLSFKSKLEKPIFARKLKLNWKQHTNNIRLSNGLV